ncbi:hypothetical protein GCM10010329_07810 [Streptomyces spiroverticillatus]|uniref:DUF6924 domain-containing protein n=1 Tax=Streptomyces finlayi TaxID=67296 RepID=A0A918WTE3_9ACTN|nr:hypothetical protein [Streptomyces finlayi]GGZ89812.1 hypothetical protein GCM10010329_07810 [Streptomyces spiroverticillatus]GHC80627.1 hypothetical protein GCM10010334_07800 [Streptomyces finlayi]
MEYDALIVRTDFGDEGAWEAVLRELHPEFRVLDRDGASTEEAWTAYRDDEDLSVVFLADRHTMTSPDRALLALNLGWEDTSTLDPTYYQDLVDHPEPRELRVMPGAVHSVHVNLQLANMDFAEFADEAATSPGGVVHPL